MEDVAKESEKGHGGDYRGHNRNSNGFVSSKNSLRFLLWLLDS